MHLFSFSLYFLVHCYSNFMSNYKCNYFINQNKIKDFNLLIVFLKFSSYMNKMDIMYVLVKFCHLQYFILIF